LRPETGTGWGFGRPLWGDSFEDVHVKRTRVENLARGSTPTLTTPPVISHPVFSAMFLLFLLCTVLLLSPRLLHLFPCCIFKNNLAIRLSVQRPQVCNKFRHSLVFSVQCSAGWFWLCVLCQWVVTVRSFNAGRWSYTSRRTINVVTPPTSSLTSLAASNLVCLFVCLSVRLSVRLPTVNFSGKGKR